MNKFLIVLCFCLSTFLLTAQSVNTCTTDLEQLYSVLQKTPSYKKQIKGVRKKTYLQLYNQLKVESQTITNEFDCFYKLAQLLMPLKDNHLYLDQTPSNELTSSKFSDSAFVQNYRSSQAFKEHLKAYLNLDSLETILQNKSRDSVEGIYFYGNAIKLGLYRTAKSDSLVGVVLSTKIPIWERGQIAFILHEHIPNRFRAYYANIIQKKFVLQKNEKFMHASLTESNWKKFPDEKDHVNISFSTPIFQLKKLDDEIQYLRLGSFSTSPKSLAESQTFYATIKDSINAKHLIVDLRNNGGGGFKASRKFLHLVKKGARHAKIYVLINNRTFSNAEQFTLKLKKAKNVVLLGETTNGTLTYGNNSGKREILPSGKFRLYITDLKGSSNNLRFEEVGVSPDIYLNRTSDWIEQTVQLIKQK